MIGKKNIVFGFLFLLLTAALGPYVALQQGAIERMAAQRQRALAALQLVAGSGSQGNRTPVPVTTENLARADMRALLALNRQLNAQAAVDAIETGPHAHGNLESLLNITVGLVLGFLAAAPLLKQVVSWLFMLGALLHAGMMYLSTFGVSWSSVVLGTGIGPALLVAGLLLTAVMAAFGFRGKIVRDRLPR